jgi:cell division protein FtsI/penicillin-binding protein 2
MNKMPKFMYRYGIRSLVTERAVVLFVILAVILLIAGIIIHQSSEKISFYKPRGYIKKVQALVDQGMIKYDRKTGKIVFDNRQRSRNIEDFYRQSYLEADIASFNEGNYIGTFNIKDGKIILDIRARQVTLPYNVLRQWTGDLYYKNIGTSAILENDHIQLQILPAPRKILPLRASHYELVPVQKENFYSQCGFLLQSDTRKYFAQVEYIGDNVVLGVKHKPPFLSVNNYKIPIGNNIRLEDGDLIYFYDGNYKDYLLFKEKGSAGLISSTRNVNGRSRRIYFSKSLNSFPMVKQFCSGLQDIVAGQDAREKEEKFDVRLTIDRKLHYDIQKELTEFKWGGGKRKMKSHYYPAAVTLMDIDSGEILAMASYPDTSSLAALGSKLRKDRKKQGYIRRLELNQNLLNHPIGSAGKPMLATAIWTVHPYLSRLKIVNHPPGKELDHTLGLSFDPPFEIFGHPVREIDRRDFLKYSCNLYMVNLFFLGLASDHEKSINFTFNKIPPVNAVENRLINFGVDFSGYLKKRANTFVNLERSPIVEALRNIFDIETEVVDSNDIRENTASRYNTLILEPIARKLSIHDKLDLRPMFSSSQEQVNLRFNQVQLLRSEFISIDFGGASSEWNNIKLAECVSRIITGGKINARLIMDIANEKASGSESPPDKVFEGYDQKINTALQWVREGMALVTTKGGTADDLTPEIAAINKELMKKSLKITLYSKTGSPRKYDKGPNSAVYIFAVILEKYSSGEWKKINGISGAIYLENRGKSLLAVTFAKRILKYVLEFLQNKYQRSNG